MCGDLARSLVDAAAEAIAPEADKQTFADGAGQRCSWLDVWQPQARAAVAAVLETLAADRVAMSDEFLRRVAAEVREGR